LVFLLVLAGAGVATAPYFGRRYIKNKLLPRLAKRFKRELSVDRIELSYGKLAMHHILVRSPGDGKRPMVVIDELRAQFRWQELLSGKLLVSSTRLDGVKVHLVRKAGRDNFSDLLRRRRGRLAGRAKLGPVRIVSGELSLHEDRGDVVAERLTGRITPGGQSRLALHKVTVDLRLGSRKRVRMAKLGLVGRLSRRDPRLSMVELEGAVVSLLPNLTLSGVGGTLVPNLDKRALTLDLHGSYGGATAKLWSARGTVFPFAPSGEVAVRVKDFSLGRIRSILGHTPLLRPQRTRIDGQLDLKLQKGKLDAVGKLVVNDLTVFHPALARRSVSGISGSMVLDASLSKTKIAVRKLMLQTGKVRLLLTAEVASPDLFAAHKTTNTVKNSAMKARKNKRGRKSGKRRRKRLAKAKKTKLPKRDMRITASLKMAPVACQDVLEAIPAALIPKLRGFRLKGTLSADLALDVDYRELGKLKLGGKLPIRNCKVVGAPEQMSAERLEYPFEHSVEIAPDRWKTVVIGPENPDYTPLAAVSTHFINALLTTEDGGFYKHRGFIRSQFRKALARNLARGSFSLGASTISMQTVKNVLLSHEKTLSRKLQELFLVWYLEKQLTKDRLMEIYVNVIELGPAIYGIGQASRHYFNKSPAELMPLEAAFFASIMPSPVRRYVQYCKGELSAGWDRYVRRILGWMHKRKKLPDEDFKASEQQKVVFARDFEALPERECRKQVKSAAKAWKTAYRERMEKLLRKVAPHQLELYFPKSRTD
jgi:hypothetical protein